MRNSLLSFWAFIIILIISSCSYEKKNTDVNNQSEKSLVKYFSARDITALRKFADSFFISECDQKQVKDCFRMHSHQIKSDFLQKIPRRISYPFNIKSGIDKIVPEDILYNLWNFDCAYQLPNQSKMNYYCLNLEGPFIDYLAEQKIKNAFIGSYYSGLIDASGMSSQLDQMMVLQSEDELDFSKLGHRILYLAHHLSVHDEQFRKETMTTTKE